GERQLPAGRLSTPGTERRRAGRRPPRRPRWPGGFPGGYRPGRRAGLGSSACLAFGTRRGSAPLPFEPWAEAAHRCRKRMKITSVTVYPLVRVRRRSPTVISRQIRPEGITPVEESYFILFELVADNGLRGIGEVSDIPPEELPDLARLQDDLTRH